IADCGFAKIEVSSINEIGIASRSFSPPRRREFAEARGGFSSFPTLSLSHSPALPSVFLIPHSAFRIPHSRFCFAISAPCVPCARLRKTSTPSLICSGRGRTVGFFSAANPTNHPCVRHLLLAVEVPVLPKT